MQVDSFLVGRLCILFSFIRTDFSDSGLMATVDMHWWATSSSINFSFSLPGSHPCCLCLLSVALHKEKLHVLGFLILHVTADYVSAHCVTRTFCQSSSAVIVQYLLCWSLFTDAFF